jgi:hypothetical protein
MAPDARMTDGELERVLMALKRHCPGIYLEGL